jgi:hypothetical protein
MAQRDLSNILSGPCRVTIDSTDVGHTVGAAELRIRPALRAVGSVASGGTPEDYVHLGETVELDLRVAEWTLANLQVLYPVSITDSAETFLAFGSEPGTRLSAHAKEMVLHPLERGDEDTSRDLTFWKATSTAPVEVAFSNASDRVFSVTFSMLPDAGKSAGERIGRIGAE